MMEQFKKCCFLMSGAERLVLIIEDMTGHRPSVFFRLSWKFFIPLFSAVIQAAWKHANTPSVKP